VVNTMSDVADIKRAENSHIWQREEHEHYVEPEWCSRRLFEVEKFEGGILDPACGFGRVVRAARTAGHHAVGSDIEQRAEGFMYALDFLTSDFPHEILMPGVGECANVVSNPPFNLFRQFAECALAWAPRKVAMIWLVRTLPAARWLQDTPLAKILYLTPRPSMPPGHVITAGEKPGGGKQDFCWLIWDKAHVGPASVGWLHRDGTAMNIQQRASE
jgi:hypothetical protein